MQESMSYTSSIGTISEATPLSSNTQHENSGNAANEPDGVSWPAEWAGAFSHELHPPATNEMFSGLQYETPPGVLNNNLIDILQRDRESYYRSGKHLNSHLFLY